MKELKEHINARIAQLNQLDNEYFDKAYEYEPSSMERGAYKQFSRDVHNRRLELEELMDYIKEAEKS